MKGKEIQKNIFTGIKVQENDNSVSHLPTIVSGIASQTRLRSKFCTTNFIFKLKTVVYKAPPINYHLFFQMKSTTLQVTFLVHLG